MTHLRHLDRIKGLIALLKREDPPEIERPGRFVAIHQKLLVLQTFEGDSKSRDVLEIGTEVVGLKRIKNISLNLAPMGYSESRVSIYALAIKYPPRDFYGEKDYRVKNSLATLGLFEFGKYPNDTPVVHRFSSSIAKATNFKEYQDELLESHQKYLDEVAKLHILWEMKFRRHKPKEEIESVLAFWDLPKSIMNSVDRLTNDYP